jgi:FlaA1/EpsC-like NDP-sugar epimerase
VEDLLGRQPISLDVKSIEDSIKGKKILITGAAGSIGSELSRQVSKFNASLVVLLDQDETGVFNISKEISEKFPFLKIEGIIADIKDKIRIKKIFEDFKPEIVFHAAAYKHVSLMEKYPEEAVKNNILGTKNVAMAAVESGAEKFIFISTDKAVNPCSIMGASKRVGEMICQSLNQDNKTKFISVRFGNVLDSRGSVVPIFRQQIQKGGPVEVTHPEMKRYFMVTPEAVLLVLQASIIGRGGEVLVLDMGQPIKILDLAKEMIKLSGLEPDKDIPIVFTSPRPGEKFFEEILTAEEGTIATQNQKIFIAKLSSVSREKLERKIERLKEAAINVDRPKIAETLKEIIPNFKQV